VQGKVSCSFQANWRSGKRFIFYAQKLGITLWMNAFQASLKTVISGFTESLHKKYTTIKINKNNGVQ
jgi:hypothetical protein